MQKKIAIIGGGNLGQAIASGIISGGFARPQDIWITRRKVEELRLFRESGVNITTSNNDAVRQADTIILAVKPFQVKDVLSEIQPELNPGKLLISVVTGISIEEILSVAGEGTPILRAMPNTAIAIRESITCISHYNAKPEDIRFTEDLFEHLGKVAIIDEALMNAATVLGACGTAYAMRYIRANIQGGIEIGFDAKTAALIAAQTVKGAAELLLTTNTHPEQEIDKVTTPKGCTIAGLNEMEHQGFSSSLIKGIAASYKKIG